MKSNRRFLNVTAEGIAGVLTAHYHKAGGRDFYNPQSAGRRAICLLEVEEEELVVNSE